jgi:hypothetical protein
MVVHRHRQETLGIVLTNDILIEELLYFYGFRKFFQIQLRGTCLLASPQSLLSNLISLGGATVADIAIHPRYEKSDFIFGATAKTASIFILS